MDGIDQTLVNVTDPDSGDIGSIPAYRVEEAMQQGFTVASPEDTQNFLDKQKYESTGQQALTALEGVGKGVSFGTSVGLERALGVDPEDIRKRAEINPGMSALGTGVGIAASALIPGYGEAALLGKAGQAGAAALGLEGASVLSQVGSFATKMAIENMMVQGGDEIAKTLVSDPNQTVETALTNVGLSGVLGAGMGAGFGAISPLWKATAGPKVASILDALQKKAGGIEAKLPDAVHDALQVSGIEVAPEIKAALSSDPEAQGMFQHLQESTTKSGIEAQESLKNFRTQASESVVKAMGKAPEEIENLKNLSEYKTGAKVIEDLHGSIKSEAEPIIKEFNDIRDRYSKIPLVAENDVLADKLANLAADEFGQFPSGSDFKFVQQVLGDVQHIGDLEGLRKLQSNLWNEAKSGNVAWPTVGKVVGILREVESEGLMRAAGANGPEAIAKAQMARSSYGALAEKLTGLNEFLKLKGWKGPDAFLDALGEAAPEKILTKLSNENNVGMINYLKQNFPAATEAIKQYHVDDILRDASKRAGPGEIVNSSALFKKISNLSPEMRDFILGPEGLKKVEALQTVIGALPTKMNTSGTAKTLDSLWSKVPGSALGLATMIMGHGNPIGFVLAPLVRFLGRDVPDAVKLSALKFLGSGQKIESEGFKAMVDFIQHTIKGENLISKASKAVFRAGQDVLPMNSIPKEKERQELKKSIKDLTADSSPLFDVGGKTAHYMPEHGTALAQTSTTAVNYLNSIRPNLDKKSPLDSEPVESPMQKATYDRALDIAQQPLVVLQSVKDGTVTPQDLVHLKTMYPALYTKLSSKLMSDLVETTHEGIVIPYKTRMGVSLFVGQPLDSTMTPESLMALNPPPMPPQDAPAPKGSSMKNLGKSNKNSMSVGQSRESRKLSRA